MKKKIFLATLLAPIIFISSCTRTSDNATIDNAATTGNWKVSFYWDTKDETSNFTGYTFTFDANGTATATIGSSTNAGTWLVKEGEFRLTVGSASPLTNISKHWLIVEKTNTSIKLKDDNPLQDDQLNLVKI